MAGDVVMCLTVASTFWLGTFLVAVLAFSAGMAAVLFIEHAVRARHRRPTFGKRIHR